MAELASDLGKPIVALKAGRSEQAQAAAVSHTASLAGSDVGARALLKDSRTIGCPPEWLIDIDTPEALARHA